MYWYISFLRPPPVSIAASSSHVTITPQIANDLRTELLYQPTDIAYVWQRVHPTSGPSGEQKFLTTWSPPASTYRPITVPLPESARVGEQWRLGLFTSADLSSSSPSKADLLDYSGDAPGILGVWSEGISLVRGELSSSGPIRGVGEKVSTAKDRDKGKGKGKNKEDDGPKQGRIVREWTLGETEMRIVEQTSFDLDKKIWDSGLALSSWFWRYLRDVHPSDLAETILGLFREQTGKLNVLELGSGTGLVSVGLALAFKERDEASLFRTVITATDLDSAIELMKENVRLNSLSDIANPLGPSDQSAVDAKVLDWDQPLPSWINPSAWPDLIIAADVTYNTSSFPSLLSTLIALLRPPHSGHRPKLLMAYKQRDPGERQLWDMLEGHNVRMELIEEIQGSEEEGKVEIWVGQWQ